MIGLLWLLLLNPQDPAFEAEMHRQRQMTMTIEEKMEAVRNLQEEAAAKKYEMPVVLKEDPPDPPPVEQPQPVEPTPPTETYIVTAYTAGYESTQKKRGEPGFGITASGAHVQEGVTIACPREIPFGTTIHIEGIGDRICQDRGGAIKGRKLDLYMEDLDRALEFGKQRLEVQIKG